MQFYKNIDDLPIWNYGKSIETGDLRYLLILEDYVELPKINGKLLSTLLEIWENLKAQIVDFIGISENAQQILRLQRTIAMLRLDNIIHGDQSNKTEILLKEKELESYFPTANQASIDEMCVNIEVQLKIPIDTKKVSVKKYYLYINYITKSANNGR